MTAVSYLPIHADLSENGKEKTTIPTTGSSQCLPKGDMDCQNSISIPSTIKKSNILLSDESYILIFLGLLVTATACD